MRLAVVIAVLFAVGCADAHAGGAGEGSREDRDVYTMEVQEVLARTLKPNVNIIIPKMKTKWKPMQRAKSFLREILDAPIPSVKEPNKK